MKKIILAFLVIGIGFTFTGCKYDDSYLNPELEKKIAYFASEKAYTRTVVVGEGMQFKIGAAMAGALTNDKDRTVDFVIGTYPGVSPKLLLPSNMYNSNELSGTIRGIIPAGQFLGYFTVKILGNDSIAFLNNPESLTGNYTIPVRLVATSLDSINVSRDSVQVSVKYQSTVEGFYLYQSVIKKEVGGVIVETKTQTDNYANESDANTFKLSTKGPYKVEVTSAANTIAKADAKNTNVFVFNLNVDANKLITYESVEGQPVITAEGTNSYDSKTRDFQLNYKYSKLPVVGFNSDTIFHVSTKLIFRNRMLDKINQTRDYLSYFNK